MASRYSEYSDVPTLRRSGTNSTLLILHLLTLGFVPFSLITFVVLATGNVYYNKKEADGSLKVWSPANRVIAFLLLIPSVLIIGFFTWYAVTMTWHILTR